MAKKEIEEKEKKEKGLKEKDKKVKEIEIESSGKAKKQQENEFTHSYVIEKPELQEVEEEIDKISMKGKKSKGKIRVSTDETEIQEEHVLSDEEREDFPYIG